MNPNDYIRLAIRTECDNEKPRERLYGLLTTETPVLMPTRLLHAILGMQDEIGEMAKAIKGWIFYGKPLDRLNLVEELGDTMWFIALMCNVLGVDMENALMEANIRKLQVRFPDKFTEALAQETSRKREEERIAIFRQINEAGDRKDWNRCDELDLRLMQLREHDLPSLGRVANKVLDQVMMETLRGMEKITPSAPQFRTKAEVLKARGTVIGCCDRHADNQACDCLTQAEIDEQRFASTQTKS